MFRRNEEGSAIDYVWRVTTPVATHEPDFVGDSMTHDPNDCKHDRFDTATYKVPQAADRAQVSERTLWRLIDAKKVPGVIRLGRSVRISKSLFDHWLDGGGAK